MKYCKDGIVYSLGEVRSANKGISIPEGIDLSHIGYKTLVETPMPDILPTQKAASSVVGDTLVWTVTDKTAEEIEAEAKALVPVAVTMRQARLALLGAGVLAAANAAIAGMPGVDGDAARIEWEYAHEVRRDAPLVAGMSLTLGLTEAQVDSLFVTAAAL